MRLKSLDSVRGIAAAVVVLYHCSLTIPGIADDRGPLLRLGLSAPGAWFYLTPLRLLVAGPTAVLLFFVLSGLVLAITFIERDGQHYGPYIVKRIARIWVPFAAAIFLSCVLDLAVDHWPANGLTTWFAMTWGEPLDPSLIAKHLLMTGDTTSLDNPMWSLIHEMRVSVVFPLLVIATRRNWKAALASTIALSLLTVPIRTNLRLAATTQSFVQTASYIWLFVAGITMAIHSKRLRLSVEKLRPAGTISLWLIAMVLLMLSPSQTFDFLSYKDALLLLTSGAGASLVVILSIAEGRALLFLTGRVPLFLGKISYSLYLTHVLVIGTVMRVTNGWLPVSEGLITSVLIALMVAVVFQRLVEVPSTHIGHHLGQALAALTVSGRRAGALNRRIR